MMGRLGAPRVIRGNSAMMRVLRPAFGVYFDNEDTKTIYQWDGTQWVGLGESGDPELNLRLVRNRTLVPSSGSSPGIRGTGDPSVDAAALAVAPPAPGPTIPAPSPGDMSGTGDPMTEVHSGATAVTTYAVSTRREDDQDNGTAIVGIVEPLGFVRVWWMEITIGAAFNPLKKTDGRLWVATDYGGNGYAICQAHGNAGGVVTVPDICNGDLYAVNKVQGDIVACTPVGFYEWQNTSGLHLTITVRVQQNPEWMGPEWIYGLVTCEILSPV